MLLAQNRCILLPNLLKHREGIAKILQRAKASTMSKEISNLVLRHEPEQIGIRLDANGWAETPAHDVLVAARSGLTSP